MFQYLWLYDFFGLFLARFVFALALFLEALNLKKRNKALMVLNIILALFFLAGLFSSLIAIFLILFEIFLLLKTRKVTTSTLLKIAFALVILFIGPGLISLDRIFNFRW